MASALCWSGVARGGVLISMEDFALLEALKDKEDAKAVRKALAEMKREGRQGDSAGGREGRTRDGLSNGVATLPSRTGSGC